ncbi:glycosyltransferase [Mariniradius sediminis]|uniref:Rhamnosyl transferase n=1 Tax=Mariniradius sediminis TaxID=2909237 RepID=A0ABS9BQM3_9BACT|nr:glycosyltransferase [Mariniradius sediminis]MCF1750317.1 putative rhamnosyl transferase [Mariniradius sediminis]
MTIKHFVFSRFNVQYLEMVPFNLGLDPEKWMEERIQLFFDYCYPSVRHQSQKNFQWVVFFDSRTPKVLLDQISAHDADGIIEFKFTDHWDKMDSEILNILKAVENDVDLIISSRLDCDDALSEKFVQTIQTKVTQEKCQPPYALNCSNGIILDVNSGIYYRKMMRSNPFISMVQDKDSLDRSIFGLQHQVVSDQINTIEIEDPKMWLQVVHGGNLVNKSSGLPLAKNLSGEFHVNSRTDEAKVNPFALVSAYLKYVGVRTNNLKFKIKQAIGNSK